MIPETARFVVGLLALVLDASLVAACARAIASRLPGETSGLDRGLTRLLLGLGLLTASVQLLGVIGWLHPPGLLGLHAALALVLQAWKAPRVPLGIGAWRTWVAEPGTLPIVLAFLVPYGFVLASMWFRPAMAADDLGYHLQAAVRWIQDGHVREYLPLASAAYFPMNGEILSTWLLIWTHDDTAGSLLNLLLYPAVLAAFVRLGRLVRIPDALAFAAGVLFLLTPGLFWTQAGTNKVDLYATFLLLLATSWILEIERGTGGRRELVLAGIAVGLSVGVKYTSLLHGGALALAACWAASRGDPRRLGERRLLRVLLALSVFASATAAFAGYWYGRNLIRTGNPVYPFAVSIGDRPMLPGALKTSGRSPLLTIGEDPEPARQLVREVASGRILSLGLLLIVPGILVAPVLHLRSRERGLLALALYLSPLPLALLWAIPPQVTVEPASAWRYNTIGTATAWLCVARTGVLFRARPVGTAGLVTAVALSSVLDLGHWCATPPPWRAAGIAGVGRGALVIERPSRRSLAAIVAAGLIGLTLAHVLRLEPRRRMDRFVRLTLGPVDEIDRLVEESPPSLIAVAGLVRLMPLQGSRFQHRLVYVPVDAAGSVHCHDRPDGDVRRDPDEGLWLDRIAASGVSLLVVGIPMEMPPGADHFPIEDDWATAHPERFRRVVDNADFRIYEVLR